MGGRVIFSWRYLFRNIKKTKQTVETPVLDLQRPPNKRQEKDDPANMTNPKNEQTRRATAKTKAKAKDEAQIINKGKYKPTKMKKWKCQPRNTTKLNTTKKHAL